jgi:hypothetical protein
MFPVASAKVASGLAAVVDVAGRLVAAFTRSALAAGTVIKLAVWQVISLVTSGLLLSPSLGAG